VGKSAVTIQAILLINVSDIRNLFLKYKSVAKTLKNLPFLTNIQIERHC